MFPLDFRGLAALAASLSCLIVADLASAEFRSITGAGNNVAHPEWGAAETNFARIAPPDYADGVAAARVNDRPNPRAVGVALMRQAQSRPNQRRLSGYVYAFGNLLSHDTQRTVAGTTELIPFRIPAGDDQFFPNQTVQLTRSLFDPLTGAGPENPRQQINFATSFIDASPVYGADELTASILRGGPANPGAKLRTSDDINGDGANMLPHDAFGPQPNAPFVAGDDRVNDNIILSCLHVVFMREHNRLVDIFASQHPEWTPEELYQRARKFVGAQMQAITFNEYLPALLGPHAPAPAGQYDPETNPTVVNEFPTVFLRIGHSMLPEAFKRIENDGRPAAEGSQPLEDSFSNPALLSTSRDLDLFLKGLSFETQEEADIELVGGMRLALLDAIDIQRARDHGIPDYNALREAYGLPRVEAFADITSNEDLQNAIAAVYTSVDSVDAFVGALAEDHLPGASVGPLVAEAFREQFERLRDGDRFWYEHDPDFTVEELTELRATRLSEVILRNSAVASLPANVFFAVPEPAAGAIALLGAALASASTAERHLSRRSRR